MYDFSSDAFDENTFSSHFPIHRACRDGDVQTVSIALKSNPQLSNLEDNFKRWTPVHWASAFGKMDCMRQVLSFEPSVINIQSSASFSTPLHCAAEGGHTHCLLLLLQAGANPEVKDVEGETALHKAARVGNPECVNLLLSASCNISSQNNCGQTACLIAAQSGFPELAAFIRQHELELNVVQASQNCLQPLRFNRKRARDVSDGTFKRRRTDDMPVITASPFHHSLSNPMITSVVEHEKLCRMENGYSSYILDMMFSEFHGC